MTGRKHLENTNKFEGNHDSCSGHSPVPSAVSTNSLCLMGADHLQLPQSFQVPELSMGQASESMESEHEVKIVHFKS